MTSEKKKNNTFPLRLPITMRQQLELLAQQEGVSINQFICIALAEKITRLDQYSHSEELSRIATGQDDLEER